MRAKKEYRIRVSQNPVAACAFFICSALVGYAGQFGNFTYEEYDTTIEITGYSHDATGDVIIPSEIVGKPVTSIGDRAFGLCGSLTSVTVPDSVTSIGRDAFRDCHSLTAIQVDAANSAFSSVDGVMFNKSQTTLITFPSGKAGSYAIPDGVTSIGDGAFLGCQKLTSVTIPDNVINIGGFAFGTCTSLVAVTIGNGVISIGARAFYLCISLKSVTIGNSVASIGDGAFYVCVDLTSVTIPDSVTTIGEGAFNSCTGLTAITVNAANPSYTSVDGVLFDKSQTTLLQFPGGKAGSFTIPDSVTDILERAFRNCNPREDVTLSPSDKEIIGDQVCPDISITIGSGVTRIAPGTFYDCINLTSVTIGTGVTSIGERAFAGCSNLNAVYFEGDAPDLGTSVFAGAYSATVYYLPGTTGWGPIFGLLPTEEISALPDPLIGGIPVDGMEGWFLSEWFGYYGTAFAPWLLHLNHGAVYRYPSSTNASSYFYDDAMGAWWWTNETLYPFIYAFNPPVDIGGTDVGSEWLFYFENSKPPRSFGVMTGEKAGSFLFFGP